MVTLALTTFLSCLPLTGELLATLKQRWNNLKTSNYNDHKTSMLASQAPGYLLSMCRARFDVESLVAHANGNSGALVVFWNSEMTEKGSQSFQKTFFKTNGALIAGIYASSVCQCPQPVTHIQFSSNLIDSEHIKVWLLQQNFCLWKTRLETSGEQVLSYNFQYILLPFNLRIAASLSNDFPYN